MSNKRVDLFFELLKFLKSDGTYQSQILDYKLKQVSLSEKQKVLGFFRSVIDQNAFFTNDHKRLRKFLIDWYSSHRSLVSQAKNTTDPFNLSSEELNELIKSFGFPYPNKIISTTRKAHFLLDLVNLYKKKGTSEVLVKTLQTYFGLSNIILSEWSIFRKPSGIFVARSKPIYPRNLRDVNDLIVELPYSSFISSDPLWRLSETHLTNLYNSGQIQFPFLTPHISLQSVVNTVGVSPTVPLAILNRRIQESYEYWQETGNLERDISLSKFEGIYSLLEIILAVVYLFNSSGDSTDKRCGIYQGTHIPFDIEDENGNRDDIVDIDYGLIIDEYNNLSVRPTTKFQREQFLQERSNKFTSEDDSIQNPIVDLLRDAGTYLESINSDFKTEIDEYIINSGGDRGPLLESVLLDLEYQMMENMGILEYPITYLIIGHPIQESLKQILDFFKPYHTKIRDFLTTFQINDPLQDSQLEADTFFVQLKNLFVDRGPWIGEFDYGMVKDSPTIQVVQNLHSYIHDDKLDVTMHDYFFHIIKQFVNDIIPIDEILKMKILQNYEESRYLGSDDLILTIEQKIREKVLNQENFDDGTWDEIINTIIKQKIEDRNDTEDSVIIGTNLLLTSYYSGNQYLDMSQVRDHVEIEVIDL